MDFDLVAGLLEDMVKKVVLDEDNIESHVDPIVSGPSAAVTERPVDGEASEAQDVDVDEEEDDDVLNLEDIIKAQQERDRTAAVLYGAQDHSVCTYPEGYKPRQSILLCQTCTTSAEKPAGVCLGCANHCHEGHDLVELYTKRKFRCDCGNEKFGGKKCTLYENKAATNDYNLYNHNFNGRYCVCNDTYPGESDETMHQCRMCEDWFHLTHIGAELTEPKWKAIGEGGHSLICRDCASKFPFMAVLESADGPKCFASYVAVNKENPEPMSMIEDFRKAVCTCDKCKNIMEVAGCLYLIDEEDELEKYAAENEAQAKTDDQEDQEVVNELVNSVGRDGAAGVIRGFNELKRKLGDFFKGKAEKGEVISKDDVEGFFAQLKRPRLTMEGEEEGRLISEEEE